MGTPSDSQANQPSELTQGEGVPFALEAVRPAGPPRTARLQSRLRAVLALIVSGAAFAALLSTAQEPARAHGGLVIEEPAKRTFAPPPPPPKPAAISAKQADAPIDPWDDPQAVTKLQTRRASKAPQAFPKQTETPAVDAPEGMARVPDFKGMRLRDARREAKRLGLKLVARHASGERIDPVEDDYYRVRRQQVEADSLVAPGSRVVVHAREIAGYAAGY